MQLIRQARRFLTKELDSNKEVFQGGDVHDEWGIRPGLFETATLPNEKMNRDGTLKQTRSMPFFSRTTSREPPVASTSSRPLHGAGHVRKNSMVAQILRIVGTGGAARDGANIPPNHGEIMSPPLLPMDLDPFARDPPRAVVVDNRSQVHHASRPAVHRPTLSMSSVPVPTKYPATHPYTLHNSASQSTNHFSVATAAQRATRSRHRTDHTKAGSLSTRSRSHPPESSSVPGHLTTSHSRPPLNRSPAVNLHSTEQHRLTSAHARYPENAFAPRVRGATVTHHKRHHQDTYDSASSQAPHLRKARSSVILSNVPPPLYAPKPVNMSERPNTKRLQTLAEPANRNLSHSTIQNVVAPARANVVWPSASVPFQVTMPPPRAERDAYRVAAHEADNMRRDIREGRAYVERIRGDRDRDRARDREVRRAERDADRQRSRHRRRATTENSRRRPGHGREVEYLSLADYGYLNGSQQWAGATFR